MLAKIVPIGTSKGLRIPKYLLDKYNLDTMVELDDTGNGLLIKPVKKNREGWAEAFRAHAEDEAVVINMPDTAWDEEEWEWK